MVFTFLVLVVTLLCFSVLHTSERFRYGPVDGGFNNLIAGKQTPFFLSLTTCRSAELNCSIPSSCITDQGKDQE